MAKLNESDEKIAKIFSQVLDEKVMPQLQKIGEQMSATMEMTAKNSEEIIILQENVRDTMLTEERIEAKVDASLRRQDDLSMKTDQLNRRVLKLESKS